MRNLWIAMALFAAATAPTVASADGCTCKYQGGDVAQGDTVCFKTSAGSKLARCEMVLNNSSWTVLNEPCEAKTSEQNSRPSDSSS